VAVSTGGAIQIANGVRVCMAAGLTFLVMRQVMPMAAGLASGLALSGMQQLLSGTVRNYLPSDPASAAYWASRSSRATGRS
jgi:hypothetical protein